MKETLLSRGRPAPKHVHGTDTRRTHHICAAEVSHWRSRSSGRDHQDGPCLAARTPHCLTASQMAAAGPHYHPGRIDFVVGRCLGRLWWWLAAFGRPSDADFNWNDWAAPGRRLASESARRPLNSKRLVGFLGAVMALDRPAGNERAASSLTR
jgi:hypothetical protein